MDDNKKLIEILEGTGFRKLNDWKTDDFDKFLGVIKLKRVDLVEDFGEIKRVFLSEKISKEKLNEIIRTEENTGSVESNLWTWREKLMSFYNENLIENFFLKQKEDIREILKELLIYNFKLPNNPLQVTSPPQAFKRAGKQENMDLAFLWSYSERKTFPITLIVTKIGRSTENNLCIKKESISNFHASIRRAISEYEQTDYFLRDEGSKFGTFIRLQSMKLEHSTKYIFEIGSKNIYVETSSEKLLDDGKWELQVLLLGSDKEMEKFTLNIGGSLSFCRKPKEGDSPKKMKSDNEHVYLLDDDQASGIHAKITFESDTKELVFDDLKSKNGSYLKLLTEHHLTNMCMIKLGSKVPFFFQFFQYSNQELTKKKCSKCKDQLACYIYFPCGHINTCKRCEKSLPECCLFCSDKVLERKDISGKLGGDQY